MSAAALHSTSLLALAHAAWRQRDLILRMTRREVLGRYRGSTIGMAWSFFNPLLMLCVYSFVFGVVFKARWGLPGETGTGDFAVVLFVGMIVHGLFAECVNNSPRLILAHPNYVKKVVFPLELLPLINVGAALFHAAISVAVLLLAMLALGRTAPPTAVLAPVVIAPLIVATLGFSYVLASLGVYARDVGQTTGLLTTVMLFLSPVFYPTSALPPEFQTLILLNPLTFIIEQSRDVLIWGRTPAWRGLGAYALASVALLAFGYWWFQKTRKGFADVL